MKIGEIYCMNLFEFLENWHPNTLISVEDDENIIFEGTVKETPLEISCKYWVQEGTVRKDEEKVVIPVEDMQKAYKIVEGPVKKEKYILGII